jgi:hypothetical protein
LTAAAPAGDDTLVRRPADDIPHKPQLKVRPIGSAKEADAPAPAVRGGTLFESPKPSGAEPPADAGGQPAPRHVSPPPRDEQDVRYAYATHRPAPPDEEAEKKELAAVTGRKPDREFSTGFVLGVALILAVLVGGILIARLQNKVGALEQRVSRVEAQNPRTVALTRRAP